MSTVSPLEFLCQSFGHVERFFCLKPRPAQINQGRQRPDDQRPGLGELLFILIAHDDTYAYALRAAE